MSGSAPPSPQKQRFSAISRHAYLVRNLAAERANPTATDADEERAAREDARVANIPADYTVIDVSARRRQQQQQQPSQPQPQPPPACRRFSPVTDFPSIAPLASRAAAAEDQPASPVSRPITPPPAPVTSPCGADS